MRKVLIVVGIVIVVLIGAAVAVVSLVDVNQFRPRIEAELRQQTGRAVTLGPMSLRLLPLAIRVSDFSIGESPAFPTGRQFASAKELSVRVDLLPLLRKEVRVDSIRLVQPAVELVKNAAGKWNFTDLGGGGAKSNAGGSGGGGTGLTLGELAVEDGTVAVSELGSAKSRSVYDHIDATLRDFAPNKPFEAALSVRLPGSGKGAVKVDAKGGPLGSDNPLTGRLTIEQASLAEFQQFLSRGARGKLDGVLSGATDFETHGSLAKAHGSLELTKARVNGADLGYPVRLDYTVDDNLDSGLLRATAFTMKVGQVPIQMSGEMNTKASTVNATVNVANAGLAEVLAAVRAFGGTEGVSGSGLLSLNLHVQGPLEHTEQLNYAGGGSIRNASVNLPAFTKPVGISAADLKFDKNTATLDNLTCSLGGSTLRGNMTARNFSAPEVGFGLNIDKLDLAELQQIAAADSGASKSSSRSGGAPSAPLDAKGTINVGSILYSGLALKNVRADCRFNRNVLTLAPLTADLFGGKQSGSITLDLRSQPAALAVNSKLDGVDANQLLSATSSVKNRLYGLVAAQTDSTMRLAPGADLARSLNGTVKLDMTKGKLVGVNVLNELSSVGKFLGYKPGSDPVTNILALGGDMKITNGVASTDNLQLRMNEGTVASTGTVNLVDQSLNLKVTAVLEKATSQQVGGSSIGGFMSTALANNKGELVIPATVTGTFEHPRFLPDAGRIAEMKLKNLLPTSANPGSLTSGILGAVTQKGGARGLLDSLTGKQQAAPGTPAAGQPQAAKPSDAVGGLLDALGGLGKKKDDKKPPAK